MRGRSENAGKGLSLGRGICLVVGYGITSATLGLAIAAASIYALYPAVAHWRGPLVGAALSLIVMGVCWMTMPANRPHVGVLILRVEMVAALAVGAFVARRLLFGRHPVLAGEVFVLVIAIAGLVIGLAIAR